MTQAISIKAGRKRLRARARGQRTTLSLILLIAFLVVVYFVVPASLPLFFQRLVGIVNALLAMVTVMFAVREFGRGYNRLRLPGIGSVRSSVVLGGMVFLAVLGWWFSPWAPIVPLMQ